MAQEQDYTKSSRALFKYITKEKKDVTAIYVYAILSGLVQLSIPLGIQAIVSFVMGATMVTSLYLLIAFVVLGTFLTGFFRIKVMQIIEKIQQKIFVEYAIAFAENTIGKVINIGNDFEISINALAKMIIEETSSRSEIIYVPYEEAYGDGFEDMERRVPSIDLIKQLVGWKPQRDLSTMISDISDEMKKHS